MKTSQATTQLYLFDGDTPPTEEAVPTVEAEPVDQEEADEVIDADPDPLVDFWDSNKGARILGIRHFRDIPLAPEPGHLARLTYRCPVRMGRSGQYPCSSVAFPVTPDEVDQEAEYQHYWGNTWEPVAPMPCCHHARLIVEALLKLTSA